MVVVMSGLQCGRAFHLMINVCFNQSESSDGVFVRDSLWSVLCSTSKTLHMSRGMLAQNRLGRCEFTTDQG